MWNDENEYNRAVAEEQAGKVLIPLARRFKLLCDAADERNISSVRALLVWLQENKDTLKVFLS